VKNSDVLHWVMVMQNVSSWTMASVSVMPVLDVGPQPSRNSKTVSTQPPFMDALSDSHWRSLVWMMKHAKMSFCAIADHAVLSHLALAKKVVSLKTFTSSMEDHHSNFNAEFFGGIAFGTNVFLCCHTDEDFSFSIIQVFLKGKSQYRLDDQVVAYFYWCCRSPTPWRLLVV